MRREPLFKHFYVFKYIEMRGAWGSIIFNPIKSFRQLPSMSRPQANFQDRLGGVEIDDARNRHDPISLIAIAFLLGFQKWLEGLMVGECSVLIKMPCAIISFSMQSPEGGLF
ncbi:MAG: hypothetical protein QXN33_05235 [Candidatus Bathyarchaeia archaeon]